MYAGSDSNLTMEMGGESIISNGLALSPKSLSISTPGRTTSLCEKNNKLGKLMKSPVASNIINLN